MYNNIFDTHSHYDDEQFSDDRAELLTAIHKNGVTEVVTCGCDIESTEVSESLAEQFDFIYFASGFHPENLEGAKIRKARKMRCYRRNRA